MYLLKLDTGYLAYIGVRYADITSRQSQALRIDDSIRDLVSGGYLTLHSSYRLVKLRQRIREVVSPVSSADTGGSMRLPPFLG